jgi:hypothetical protein
VIDFLVGFLAYMTPTRIAVGIMMAAFVGIAITAL